ncbi:MAG: CHAT domain-containing protein [Bacteroidetes bacterium]|nr:CHAT domain-containing protein [Bacteroidota bacterium]MBS1541357.1 CHAT domain-containing protein [Bacteroidota bacterium]
MRRLPPNLFWIVLIVLLALSVSVFSQEDKPYHDALKEYEAGNFKKSFADASASLALLKDPKIKAYTLQLITSSCMAMEDTDAGLRYVSDEIELFKQIEGVKSKSLAEAYKKKIIFLNQKNLNREASAICEQALPVFEQSYGGNSLQTATFKSLTGEVALASADSAKAALIWDDCIPLLAAEPNAWSEYRQLLFNAGMLSEALKNYSSAKEKLSLCVLFLEKANQTDDEKYTLSQQALERLKKKEQGNPDVDGILRKALSLQESQQYTEALKIFKSADTEVAKSPTSKTTFSFYFNYARCLMSLEKYDDADNVMKKANEQSKGLFAATSPEIFLVTLTAADILLGRSQKTQASQYYLHASKLLTKNFLPSVWRDVLNSSKQLINNDMPRTALALLAPSVRAGRSQPDDSFFSASGLYADAFLSLNLSDSALSLLNTPVYDKAPDYIQFKKVDALIEKGLWNSALEKLNHMSELTRTEQAKGDLAYQTAQLLQTAGDYDKAEGYYKQAIASYTSTNSNETWYAENSLATLYMKLGNFYKAETIFNSLLTKIPASAPLYFTVLENLAAGYIETNELKKAKIIQEQRVEAEKKKSGENSLDYAFAISNLAVLYQREGKYQEAVQLFEQATAVVKNRYGEQSVEAALKENNLASALKDIGLYEKSKTVAEHALQVLLIKLTSSHPDYVLCEYNLAMIYKRLGKVEQAIPLMQHMAGFYLKQINDLFQAMNEQEQVSFLNRINKVIQDYQLFAIEMSRTHPELVKQLLDFRLATKALLLNSSMKVRGRILNGKDLQLRDQFLSWLNIKNQLGKLYLEIPSPQVTSQIDQLENHAADLEKLMAKQSSSFKLQDDERKTLWQNVQSSLSDTEAAIELMRVRGSSKKDSVFYAAIIVTKNSAPELVVLQDGKKLEDREYRYYRNTILNQQGNDHSYGVYWKQIDDKIKDKGTVYVSADGIYNKINLSTLYDSEQQNYLAQRHTFILVSNLRDVMRAEEHNSSLHEAALLGPVYFRDSTRSLDAATNQTRTWLPDNEMPALPATQTEIEHIAALLRNKGWITSVNLKEKATENTFKKIKDERVIHVATHGFFIEESDEDIPVVLQKRENMNNPLLHSGLVLKNTAQHTKDTPSDEDGILTAYEIKNLNLDKTSLVVLSACETGSGQVRNGEGVYGLQRSFLISGVKNVLMSLWKVDDQATQELMILFYQNFLNGNNTAQALRLAQNELIKKYPSPYFWGSFVLIGKPI